jgi:phosphoglycerol transferase MdoB-like AlkP superfamily enzyme
MFKFIKNADLHQLKSIRPIVLFGLLSLLIFALFRVIFTAIYWERVVLEPQFWKTFFIGMRIDLILICYYSSLPLFCFLVLPKKWILKSKWLWIVYFSFFITVIFMMEMSTYAFIEQYDLRPDRIFIEYLDHMEEVSKTIMGNNPISVVLTIVFSVVIAITASILFKRIMKSYDSFPLKTSFILLPLLGGLIFLGARSSLKPRPANISTAYFSNKSKMANELSLNSTFSVFCAFLKMKDEKDPSRVYGKMGAEEILARVSKYNQFKAGKDKELPFMHTQTPGKAFDKPLNIVIFLQESLGAEYVGCLNGLPLTPKFDSLSNEGMLLTNLYCTGTRTVRGIEAVTAGFLPTPGRSVVKLSKSRSNFFTIAQLLKEKGYSTNFIYGGMSNFDDMKLFFKGNGITNVYDEESFENPSFKGVWGCSDEDLAVKANEVFKKQDKPFFGFMLSTSNHAPFEYPEGRIVRYDKNKAGTVHNAMKYADFAIGKFFELAKKEKYYENTIFLVVADHNTRVYGDDIVPINKFHIPGLIIGPEVAKGNFNRLCSQIDLAPTLLSMAGIESQHPMIGTDLSNTDENYKGRSIMQLSNKNAFRVGDTVVIHQPNLPAKCFLYKNSELQPIANQPELIRDALAHALLPWLLYSNRMYKTNQQ